MFSLSFANRGQCHREQYAAFILLLVLSSTAATQSAGQGWLKMLDPKAEAVSEAHATPTGGGHAQETPLNGPVKAQSLHAPTLEDLETLKTPDGYLQLSPIGDNLVYIASDRIWLVSTRVPGTPKPIAKVNLPTLPIWSPNGKWLAYYSTESGSRQLWVLDVSTTHAEQITNLPGGIDPDWRTGMVGWIGDPYRFSWSPDGTKIVFASQVAISTAAPQNAPAIEPGNPKLGTPLVLTLKTPADWTLSGIFTSAFGPLPRPAKPGEPAALPPAKVNQLFIVDVATKALRQLTKDDAIYFNPDWSPDGRTIVCASSEGRNPSIGPTNLYAIDPATGEKTALTTGSGDKRLPRWSPDGKWIAFTGGKHFGRLTVFVIPAKGGEPLDVGAQIKRSILDFQWFPDSRSLALLVWNGVDMPIVRVSASGGPAEKLTGEAADREFLISGSRDGALAWEQQDGSHLGLIVFKPQNGVPSILVDLNPQIRSWELGSQEVIRWRDSRGGRHEGILIKPAGYRPGRRYPLIVDCYPNQRNGFKGTPMLGNQVWASRGYVVFWPNARAPHIWMNSFLSPAWDQAAKGPNGWNVTVDDVLSGVDELIRRGIVDPNRMGLYGFSNGSGIVNYLITRTKRFKCAVSVAGVYPDWLLPFFLHTDSPIPTFEGGTSPFDDPAAYVQLSAVFHLKSVNTPVLLADGDNDDDFLLGSIEMFNGLRWLHKDVTFLRYPDQGHGFHGAAMKDFWAREAAFFDDHLKSGLGTN